ncbi:MAG: class I SAM-dependent methyltransferase [Phycisphaerales bacterium JB040]
MSGSDEGTPYLDPYREAVSQVGARFEALLWKSAEAQAARFAAISQMCDPTGRVIADLGCGRADYASWMHGTGLEYGRYVGVEGVPELADSARERIGQESIPECEVQVADFVADEGLFARLVRTQRADTLVFSGSLNTLDQRTAEGVIERAYGALEPRGVVVFNFLSDRHGDDRIGENTGPATRFDTARFVHWALDRSPLVRFRQDYLKGHDATIAIEKV